MISPKKVVSPSIIFICMGICIGVDAQQLCIPQKKVLGVLDMCSLCANKVISKSELQSLLVKLLFMQRCVNATRGFMNRLLTGLKNATHHLRITIDMR